MRAKDLIKVLQKLPPDTIVCKTDEEYEFVDLGSASYYPSRGFLCLEPWLDRKGKDFLLVDEWLGRKGCKKFTKPELRTIRNLAEKGKKIVEAKHDGKMHRIKVLMTEESAKRRFTLRVGRKIADGLLEAPTATVVCCFKWESFAVG